jgi:hypothetical protein
LRTVQSAIHKGWQERKDPRQVWVSVAPSVEALGGDFAEIRKFAPMMGEVWDVFVAMAGHAQDLHDQLQSVLGEPDRAGLPSTVSAASSGDRADERGIDMYRSEPTLDPDD